MLDKTAGFTCDQTSQQPPNGKRTLAENINADNIILQEVVQENGNHVRNLIGRSVHIEYCCVIMKYWEGCLRRNIELTENY